MISNIIPNSFFRTQLSALGKFIETIYLGLNCRRAQLTLFVFGTQFVLRRNLFRDSIVASPLNKNTRCLYQELTYTLTLSISQLLRP